MNIKCKKEFIVWIIILSVLGMLLRWTGIHFIGVDYENCLLPWYQQLKAGDGMHALAEFQGNYNMPYATALLLLTYLPVAPIYSIKLLSIAFDYLCACVLTAFVMDSVSEKNIYMV